MTNYSNNECDSQLVERICQQDNHAFEQLYYAYHERLYRFIWRLLKDKSLIEEALNDTMMTVWEKARSFKKQSKISTWIFGIAYRKAMETLRSNTKMKAESLDFEIQDEHEKLDQDIQSEWIKHAVNRLPDDQKAVVELTYFNGFSYQEIAEVMQCPVGTVKTRMFHARKSLKLKLAA